MTGTISAQVFDRVLPRFTIEEQKDLYMIFAKWELGTDRGPRIVPNIKREIFLEDDKFFNLIRVLIDAKNEDIKDIQAKYEKHCWTLTRQGGAVALDSSFFPLAIGRAVTRVELKAFLLKSYASFFGIATLVDDFLDRLSQSWCKLTADENRYSMSTFSAWVTWHETDQTADPFSFTRSHSADEVRAFLGLLRDSGNRLGPLFLLVYTAANPTELCRPTIADAALYPYFHPPEASAMLPLPKHGWTMPWPAQEIAHIHPALEPRARPEAVHAPLPFSLLALPVRIRN